VLDNGTGIAGACVTANSSISNTTDASGSFSFLVVAGTYYLTATREPEYYGNSSVVVNATSGSIAAQDIQLTRKPTGNITGTVKRSTPGSSIVDLNGDGVVDEKDLDMIIQLMGNVTLPPYPNYDVNQDGIVDILDIELVLNQIQPG
jgi:hypothetical protein